MEISLAILSSIEGEVYYQKSVHNYVPMAQTSTGVLYMVSPTSSSGARYHRVAT